MIERRGNSIHAQNHIRRIKNETWSWSPHFDFISAQATDSLHLFAFSISKLIISVDVGVINQYVCIRKITKRDAPSALTLQHHYHYHFCIFQSDRSIAIVLNVLRLRRIALSMCANVCNTFGISRGKRARQHVLI